MTPRKTTPREVIRLEGRAGEVARCELMLTTGGRCDVPALYRITRIDGSSYVVCTRHLSRYQKMVSANPGRFHVVTVDPLK